MSSNQKGFVIIASLIIVIVTGGMIIKTIHKNNVNKEKEEDYQIISKKIKSLKTKHIIQKWDDLKYKLYIKTNQK